MKKINLTLQYRDVGVIVDVVQGSTLPELEFFLADFSIPEGASANIYIKKPSGATVYNAGIISANSVRIHPTKQMFAEAGVQEGQLKIISGTEVIMSYLLTFRVEKSIINDAAIESTNEFTALEAAVQTVAGYNGRITTAERAISDIKSEQITQNAAIESIQSEQQTQNTEISNIKSQQTTQNQSIASLRSDITISESTLQKYEALGWVRPTA